KGTWLALGKLLGTAGFVADLYARLQAVQLGDLQRFVREVDAGDFTARLCQAFGQNASAAADIQDFFARQRAGNIQNPSQAQGIDGMQRLEFAFGIPPSRGESAEFVQFGLVYIVAVRAGRGRVHWEYLVKMRQYTISGL